MSDDAPKSRSELRRMFWHDFAGSLRRRTGCGRVADLGI